MCYFKGFQDEDLDDLLSNLIKSELIARCTRDYLPSFILFLFATGVGLSRHEQSVMSESLERSQEADQDWNVGVGSEGESRVITDIDG